VGDIQGSVLVVMGIVLLCTLAWMGVQVMFLLRVVEARRGGEKVDKSAVVLWIVSAAGLFTGPCAMFFCLVGVAGGIYGLKRAANAPTRQAALGTLVGSAIMVVMISAMLLALWLAGAFNLR